MGNGLSAGDSSTNHTFLGSSIRCVVALQCAGTLKALRFHATSCSLLLLLLFVRSSGHDLLIFGGRTQVADGGYKVLHRLDRRICLEIWIEMWTCLINLLVIVCWFPVGVERTLIVRIPVRLILDGRVDADFGRRNSRRHSSPPLFGCSHFFVWGERVSILLLTLHATTIPSRAGSHSAFGGNVSILLFLNRWQLLIFFHLLS